MAKFYGVVGYSGSVESKPGVWTQPITERHIYGDLIRNSKKTEGSGKVNEDISISNQISFLADPYANMNFHKIKYVKFMGTSWKVLSVEVQSPRLLLTLGGVYNEE